MLRIIAGVLILSCWLGVARQAKAGGCYGPGYGYNYYPSYPAYYPSYPAYYPGYYAYPAQKVVAQEIAVSPLIVTVPVDYRAMPVGAYGVDHYWAVQNAYQANQSNQQFRTIVREELNSAGLIAGGGNGAVAGGAINRTTTNQAGANQAVAPQQGAKQLPPPDLGIDNETPETVATPAIQAFSTSCVPCHLSAPLKGNLRLLYQVEQGGVRSLRLAKQTDDRRWKIYGMASTGVMPPGVKEDPKKVMPSQLLPGMLKWVLEAR